MAVTGESDEIQNRLSLASGQTANEVGCKDEASLHDGYGEELLMAIIPGNFIGQLIYPHLNLFSGIEDARKIWVGCWRC